jgi:UDP-N-acetyl-D-galactosamine dehydrogenase
MAREHPPGGAGGRTSAAVGSTGKRTPVRRRARRGLEEPVSNGVDGQKVCVLGLGYVGLPLAVEFAKRHKVIGFDIDAQKIEELKRGFDRMHEVTTEELQSVRMEYTTDPARMKDAEYIIVAVPTPIDKHNNPDLFLVEEASRMVGRHMARGTVVAFESTVYPGVTEDICLPILEKESGLRCPEDFSIGYSPERVNPGDREHVIPKVVKIVAGYDERTLDKLAALYGSIVPAGIHRAPNIRTAEAAKVIENVQRDLNIALVNELAMIFERMGIRTRDVVEAAGTKWNFHKYTPGLVGGHCIGVDPYYLTHKAQELGYHPEIILAGRRLNDNMHRYVVQRLVRKLNQKGIASANATVLVLGLTFKENCSDPRNSRAKHLIAELKNFGYKVLGCDPWLSDDVIRTKFKVEPVAVSQLGVMLGSGSVQGAIVSAPHKEFYDLPLEAAACVIDIKGVLPGRFDSL